MSQSQLMQVVSENFRYELLFLGNDKVRITFRNMPNDNGVTTSDNAKIGELERSAYRVLDLCELARKQGLDTKKE